MKTLIVTALLLASSSSHAFKIKCDAAVGPRLGRPTTEVEITYQDGHAYIYKTINGYTFNGSCSKDNNCNISIMNEEKIKGYVDTNGSFSKLNDYSISIGHSGMDDIMAEITCQKIK